MKAPFAAAWFSELLASYNFQRVPAWLTLLLARIVCPLGGSKSNA